MTLRFVLVTALALPPVAVALFLRSERGLIWVSDHLQRAYGRMP